MVISNGDLERDGNRAFQARGRKGGRRKHERERKREEEEERGRAWRSYVADPFPLQRCGARIIPCCCGCDPGPKKDCCRGSHLGRAACKPETVSTPSGEGQKMAGRES